MADMLDFLAIGDITTDTFITLKEASVHCDINDEACTISMKWGDKIPYESAEVVSGVGNAANAAVSAARLGLRAGLLTYAGKDENGDADIATLAREGVDTAFASQVEGISSNHDFVLCYDSERTILIKHGSFPYRIPDDLTSPRFIYLSSLGDPSGKTHAALAAWLEEHPETKLLFQPGLEIRMDRQKLEGIYRKAYLSVCNKEEAEHILGYETPQDMRTLLEDMHAIGPEIVMITDGPRGVHALEDGNYFHVPMFPDPKPPLQRTGAGDALASTTAAYLVMGMPLKDAIFRGTINAAYVVQGIGAQKGLLRKEELEKIAKQK